MNRRDALKTIAAAGAMAAIPSFASVPSINLVDPIVGFTKNGETVELLSPSLMSSEVARLLIERFKAQCNVAGQASKGNPVPQEYEWKNITNFDFYWSRTEFRALYGDDFDGSLLILRGNPAEINYIAKTLDFFQPMIYTDGNPVSLVVSDYVSPKVARKKTMFPRYTTISFGEEYICQYYLFQETASV